MRSPRSRCLHRPPMPERLGHCSGVLRARCRARGVQSPSATRSSLCAPRGLLCATRDLLCVPLPIQVPGQLSVFDFSERKQSNKAAAVVPTSCFGGGRHDQRGMLVTRVGDALQEPCARTVPHARKRDVAQRTIVRISHCTPRRNGICACAVWPEGLGINRGFLHVLDCADLVQGYAAHMQVHGPRALSSGSGRGGPTPLEASLEAMLQRREGLFAHTKRVSGHNRLTELRPFEASEGATRRFCYTIDPHSRYNSLPASLPPHAGSLATKQSDVSHVDTTTRI